MPQTRISLCYIALALSSFLCPPPGRARAADRVDYLASVKPLLAARCYACHGALQQKGGLRLDTVQLLKAGGDGGPAISPGWATESKLLDHVQGIKGARRMPPSSEGEPLGPAEVALLRAWIDQGANGSADEKPEADPRAHYAFRAPVRPTPPRVKNLSWGHNPIDQFIGSSQEKLGLRPQPPADRRLFLRRVYLDLVGLPPTRKEQEDFLADESPDACEKVVDRLLASPLYGERWGRHWLDVWRYSDWWGLGAEVRNSQKHVWHWRDWVVESLNADKGYDQMVLEMLAADELYPADPDKLRATGFLARSYFKFNRNTWLEEVVEHTSKAFLGLTMNCAKCHDHKYDPISQQDFYRMRAFFEPYQVRTDVAAGQLDLERDGIPRAFDCDLEAPTHLFVRGDEKNPRKDRPLGPGLPVVLAPGKFTISPVKLPIEGYAPGVRPCVLQTHLLQAEASARVARDGLEKARKALIDAEKAGKDLPAAGQARLARSVAEKILTAAELQPDLWRARAAADRARLQDPPPANAPELVRAAARLERQVGLAAAEVALAQAELDLARAPVAKKVESGKRVASAKTALAAARNSLAAPGESYQSLRGSLKTLASNVESEASRNRPFPRTSTGRRTALARWIVGRENPLAARVAVNHVWARHFGKPLVSTVFDFGRKGASPTHPELLDWLAVELVESGWSLKHLHRLIVTSRTYQLSSTSRGAFAENLKADPENRFYWRGSPVRMEAQVLRDSLLYLSGDLDSRMGGPPVPASDEGSRRRSLYFTHSHNDRQKFLGVFDDANPLECYRRAESILPQQALALQNAAVSLEAARKVAARLTGPGLEADSEFIKAAFETVLGCSPSKEEQAACADALRELAELGGREKWPDVRGRARATLVHALLNHNDFITVR